MAPAVAKTKSFAIITRLLFERGARDSFGTTSSLVSQPEHAATGMADPADYINFGPDGHSIRAKLKAKATEIPKADDRTPACARYARLVGRTTKSLNRLVSETSRFNDL